MKKENFVGIINAIIAHHKKEEKFADAMEPFFENSLVCTLNSTFITSILNSLENEMDDEDDEIGGTTISWWLYDAPKAGNNAESCYVILPNKEKIRVDTPGQLYDFLKLEMNESQ